MTLLKILILLFANSPSSFSIKNLDEFTNPFSPDLSIFLSSNLHGCLIKAVVGSHQLQSSSTLQDLMNYYQFVNPASTATLAIRLFIDQQVQQYRKLQNDSILKIYYPLWHPFKPYKVARHTSCFAHLYFVESWSDIITTANYFLREADLAHEDPNYLIFWDNTALTIEVPLKWNGFFTNQLLYGKFTSLRFLIKYGCIENGQRVAIICMICSKKLYGPQYPLLSYFNNTIGNPPTSSNIAKVWAFLYLNHRGLNIPHICNPHPCKISNQGRRLNNGNSLSVEYFVHQILILKFNITTTSEKRRLLDKHGMITRNLIFPSTNIHTFFLRNATPTYIISPYGILPFTYHILTIMDKENVYNNWVALLQPISEDAWIAFLAVHCIIATIIVLVLLIVSNKQNGISKIFQILIDTSLHMSAAMLDQHHRKGIPHEVVFIYICWAWFAFNFNSIYKGKLFSRLSVTPEPWIPTNLKSAAESGYPIVSSAQIIATMQDNPIPNSLIRGAIHKYLEQVGNNNKHISNTSFEYLRKIDKRLIFCPMKDKPSAWALFVKFSTCKSGDIGVQGNVSLPQSFIILDSAKSSKEYLAMFRVFTDKWVSSVIPIEEFPTWNPWLIQKTYFAKLVLPVLAQWYECGLSGYWDNKYDEEAPISAIKRVNATNIVGISNSGGNQWKENVGGSETKKNSRNGDDHHHASHMQSVDDVKKIDLDMLWPLYITFCWLDGIAVVVLGLEIVFRFCKSQVKRAVKTRRTKIIVIRVVDVSNGIFKKEIQYKVFYMA